MGLETGTWVDDLVVTNPPGSDFKSQGDDHLRLIKNVLRNTFKRASKAFYLQTTQNKFGPLTYSVLSSDDNTTFTCDTNAGVVQLSLPTLTSGDAGWNIGVVSRTGASAFYIRIVPPVGTISGFTSLRRSVEHNLTRIVWTGGTWAVTRSNGNPIGSVVEYYGTTLPPGHLWADGSAFSSSDYVELNQSLGAAVTPDRRGRAAVGRDNMGVGAANRVTSSGSGINGATLGANGGTETHTLTTAQLAVHSHGTTESPHGHSVGDPTHGHGHTISDSGHGHGITDPQHDHGVSGGTKGGTVNGVVTPGATSAPATSADIDINPASTGVTVNTGNANIVGGITAASTGVTVGTNTTGLTINNSGSGAAHQNMPPTLICNAIVVAE